MEPTDAAIALIIFMGWPGGRGVGGEEAERAKGRAREGDGDVMERG